MAKCLKRGSQKVTLWQSYGEGLEGIECEDCGWHIDLKDAALQAKLIWWAIAESRMDQAYREIGRKVAANMPEYP